MKRRLKEKELKKRIEELEALDKAWKEIYGDYSLDEPIKKVEPYIDSPSSAFETLPSSKIGNTTIPEHMIQLINESKSVREHTKKAYNSIYENYKEQHHHSPVMKKHYQKFQSFLPSGKIIDLGCGTGRDANELSLLGYDVYGIDYSEKMLSIAKNDFPHLSFMEGDMLKDLKDSAFYDGVWSCASLLHFKEADFRKALNIIKNILKDEGIFFLSMKLSRLPREEWKEQRYFRIYTFEEICMHLLRQEFEILFFEQEEDNVQNNLWGNFIARKKPKKKEIRYI